MVQTYNTQPLTCFLKELGTSVIRIILLMRFLLPGLLPKFYVMTVTRKRLWDGVGEGHASLEVEIFLGGLWLKLVSKGI